MSVAGRADIPWAREPKAEAEILYVRTSGGDCDFGPDTKVPEPATAPAWTWLARFAVLSVLAPFSALALWGGSALWKGLLPERVGARCSALRKCGSAHPGGTRPDRPGDAHAPTPP